MTVTTHAIEVGTAGRRYLGRNHARWVFHLAVDLAERGRALWVVSLSADDTLAVDVQWGAEPTADELRDVAVAAIGWRRGDVLPVDADLAAWGGL